GGAPWCLPRAPVGSPGALPPPPQPLRRNRTPPTRMNKMNEPAQHPEASPEQQPGSDAEQAQEQARREAQEHARQKAITDAPYVSVTIQSSGIHPSTSRMITFTAITLTADNKPVETFHAVLNPGTDPGPFHLHGVTDEEFRSERRFSQILKAVDRLIDGRTLIL